MTRVSRWSIILTAGLGFTLLTAGAAALLRDDNRLLTFVVFALTVGPVGVGGAWGLVPDASRPTAPEHSEDTIEQAWIQRASSGAFLDLVTAMGLSLAATSVLKVSQVPVLVFLVLAMLDMSTRLFVLSRREG